MIKRIAFCSPVNPVESGISDYSEELLPFLGQYVDITLFVDEGVTPTNQQVLRRLSVEPISRFLLLQRQHPFDAVVYHMGNSPAHSRFLTLLDQVPGVVVLHDFVLHHLMLWHAVNRLKQVQWYHSEVNKRYGAKGSKVAQMMERGQFPEQVFDFPLSELVIEKAQGLIAHSAYVTERAKALRPDLALAQVPMGVPLPDVLDRAAARKLLDLPLDVPIWASFGHINPYKRIEQGLRAFARFREHYPQALYTLVGSVSAHYGLQSIIDRLGLQDSVRVTGYVANAEFMHYVAAADLCFNGRFPSAGETSASLLRVLGSGRVVLVSDIATFSELPRSVVGHVPVNAAEEDVILGYAEAIFAQPELKQTLEANARDFVAQQHSLSGAARGYADFLAHVYQWPELEVVRQPLWKLEDVTFAEPSSVTSLLGQRAADLGIPPSAVRLLNRAVSRIKKLVG